MPTDSPCFIWLRSVPLTRTRLPPARGLDSDRIFREIVERNLRAFASKPLTLFMMLDIAAENGELPSSLRELYEQGLRASLSRAGAWTARSRNWTRIRRYAVARRLAAASVCSNTDRFALAPGDVTSRSMDPAVIVGGREQLSRAALSAELEVQRAEIDETLRTGLFKGSANGVVTWIHRSLAEFLAADWLSRDGIDLERRHATSSVSARESIYDSSAVARDRRLACRREA